MILGKRIFRSLLSFSVAVVIFLLQLITLSGCDDGVISGEEYAAASGWSVSAEEFKSSYIPHYEAYVKGLRREYGLGGEHYFETREGQLRIYLYDPSFTLCIFFGNSGGYGELVTQLFYFGDTENPESINDYAAQSKLIELMLDIIHTFGFDTVHDGNTNPYEVLFEAAGEIGKDTEKGEDGESSGSDEGEESESKESSDPEAEKEQNKIAFYSIHSSEELVDLGYTCHREYDCEGYYYMMKKDSAIDDRTYLSNSFSFYGLLKPISESEK